MQKYIPSLDKAAFPLKQIRCPWRQGSGRSVASPPMLLLSLLSVLLKLQGHGKAVSFGPPGLGAGRLVQAAEVTCLCGIQPLQAAETQQPATDGPLAPGRVEC